MSIWVIYKATGKCGRGYIGLTKNGKDFRWKRHLKAAANGEQSALYNAIRKYGPDWFTVEVICECYSVREAKACERAMIASHGTYAHTGGGFNLTYGGDGNWGWKPSAEVRAKIGAKSSERLAANPEYAKLMGLGRRGKKKIFTAEHRANMSRANKGRVLPPEWRAKISAAGKGRKHSPESIEKMKAARPKGTWKPSAETCAKISASKRGKKLSAEHRELVTKTLSENRWKLATPEVRAKISDTQKAFWNDPMRKAERKALQNTPEFRAKLSAGVRRANENMSPESKRIHSEAMAKNNRNPAVKALHRRIHKYELALAARIGYSRPCRVGKPTKADIAAGRRVFPLDHELRRAIGK